MSLGNYGSFVDDVSDKDHVSSLSSPAATTELCIGFLNDDSGNQDERAWFFHIDADGADDACAGATVEAGRSFMITQFGGSSSEKWITSSDTTYTSKSFDTVNEISSSAAWLCYLESDGVGGYSFGDPVYVDTGTFTGGSDGSLSLFDLRLVDVSTSENAPFSISVSIVDSASDSDLDRAADTTDDPTRLPSSESLTCNGDASDPAFDARYLDLGSLGTVDDDDIFYLVSDDLDSTDAPVQGTVRLTSGASLNAGKKVKDGDRDHDDFLETLTSTTDIALVATSATATTDKELYFHFPDPDGTEDHVLMHDLSLKTSTGTSASSPGRLVTSTSNGANTAIDSTLYDLEDRLYYIDVDGDDTYDMDEPVYLVHPDNTVGGGACSPGAGETCIQVNDIRVEVDSQTSGSLVEADDTDYKNYRASFQGQTGFTVQLFSEEGDTRAPLKSASNVKHEDKDDDNFWDPASESVYLSSNNTVTGGDTRLWDNGTGEVSATITCGTGSVMAECGTTLESNSNFQTTGPDSTWDEDLSEWLYYSDDSVVSIGDYRVAQPGGTISTATQDTVAAGDSDLTWAKLQSGDTALYITQSGANYPAVGDIELYPNFGDRLTSSDTEVVPTLSTVTPRLARVDYGEGGSFTDDAYYLDFSGSWSTSQILRLTPYDGAVAGEFLTDSDSAEVNADPSFDSGADASDDFGYLEVGGSSGFGQEDLVYLDVPSTNLNGPNDATLGLWDARMVETSFGGSTYKAGSRVQAGETDQQSFGGDAWDGTTFTLYWWDADLDGNVNSDDMVYLRQGSDSATTPNYLDIRLVGTGGSSGGGGSGGGGGGGGGSTPTVTNPSVSITAPSNGAYVQTGEAVTISGTASGGTYSLSSVTISVGGSTVGTATSSPWSATWTPASDGTYTLTATAEDTRGNTQSASVTVTANAEGEAPPDNGDGEEPPADTGVDEEARQQAQQAQQSAQEAKEAAQQAQQSAQEAKETAEQARETIGNNSNKLDQIADALGNRSGEPTDDSPGFGLLAALAAIGLALAARRRWTR